MRAPTHQTALRKLVNKYRAYNITTLADALGTSRMDVMRLVKDGKLPPPVAGRWSPGAIHRHINQRLSKLFQYQLGRLRVETLNRV